jgi:putative ABC transport system permease protein
MGHVLNAFVIGFKEIWAHKFRSALTMLGIILGVASLVGMSALVKGIENGMREALIAVGGLEKVRVEENDLPTSQQHLADQAVGVTMADVYAIQRNADLVRAVTPKCVCATLSWCMGRRVLIPGILPGRGRARWR